MTDQIKAVKKTRDEIALAYKSEPWWYDVRGFFILTFAYNSTLWSQIGFFSKNFGKRHLELAIGSGSMAALVLGWRRWKGMPAVDIVGVDYAEAMLAGAVHRFQDQANMEFLLADAADLPLPDNDFDTVNIANSVHCFPDVRGALKNVYRVLKPGGTFALNVLLYPRGIWPLKSIAQRINAWGIRKGILVTPYDETVFRNLLVDTGFELISDVVKGNCLEVVARKPVVSGGV